MKSSRWAPKPATAVEQPLAAPETVRSPSESAPQDTSAAPASTFAQSEPAPTIPSPIEAPLPQEYESQTIPTYDATMDEFAQTREDDDLFDDDVIPLSDPTTVIVDAPVPVPAPVPAVADQPPPSVDEKPIPTAPAAHNNRGRGGARGRGRGRGNHTTHAAHAAPKEPVSVQVDSSANEAQDEGTNTSDSAAKDAPATPTLKKESAVRGDRSGTGGIKKAKLTEAELTARLASISLKNASLTAAHARAEADAASFEEREARAAVENQKKRRAQAARVKEEKVNRSEMLGERERNRLRKMNAVMGREWDAEKEELGAEERKGGNRRGAYGGVVRDERRSTAGGEAGGEDGSEVPAVVEDVNSHAPSGPAYRARGRGRGRGPRAGRGTGRGDSHSHQHSQPGQNSTSQAPPSASDFPDLPPSTAAEKKEDASPAVPIPLSFPKKGLLEKGLDTQGGKGVAAGLNSPDTPVDGKRSWADQVEREGRND